VSFWTCRRNEVECWPENLHALPSVSQEAVRRVELRFNINPPCAVDAFDGLIDGSDRIGRVVRQSRYCLSISEPPQYPQRERRKHLVFFAR
jgi:hypothetical protein